MKIKSIDFNWLLLVVAIVLGSIAAWSTKSYFVAREKQLIAELSNDNVSMSDVIVATQSLEKGDLVSQSNMSVRKMQTDFIPLDAIHPSQFGAVDGQMLLENMAPGRPLLSTYLPGNRVKFFSSLLKEGQRAVTIDIDENNSTAGMLVPSDHIDLLLSFKEPTMDGTRNKLQLLLENVVVIATGRRSIDVNPELANTIYDNPSNYNTVTLALSIEDAARVNLAKQKGNFVTLLRNQKEVTPLDFTALHEGQIFNISEDEFEQRVEIIAGGGGIRSSIQTYPLSEEIQKRISQLKEKNSL